jgi:hypothetical protein
MFAAAEFPRNPNLPPTMPSTPSSRSTAIDPILEAHRAGAQALLVSGRSLLDLHIDEAGQLRPLRHTLMRRVREEFGMATLVFNLALGARWSWEGFSDEQRREFEGRLDLRNLPLQQELRDDSRGREPLERACAFLKAVYQTIERGSEIPPIFVLIEFGEDIIPHTDSSRAGDWVLQMSELLFLIGHDYRCRRHPLLIALTGVPERMDRRAVDALRQVPIAQPDREEKLRFLEAIRSMPHLTGSSFEEGLDPNAIANLTARTPNRSLEEALLESARTRTPVSNIRLVERKRADVVTLSEGTLSPLDVERVRGIHLRGMNVERVLALLLNYAGLLKHGDPDTPMNILLAGAPSSAKTDLALLAALHSQTPAYSFNSPKDSLVGGTERRVRLLFRIFKELSPAFGFIDEITEAFQTQRTGMNLDSGASDAITAEMLTALSDASRKGRSMLIATTNCPWKIGSAMASRFTFIPVLSATEADYPLIVAAIASHLFPEVNWDAESGSLQKAATTFFSKGATPRAIRTLLSSKRVTSTEKNPEKLLMLAAQDCAPQHPRDRAGAEYADLYALSVCTDQALYPWHGRIDSYPLPACLKGIVDSSDGSIDPVALQRRIEQLKPHVNV